MTLLRQQSHFFMVDEDKIDLIGAHLRHDGAQARQHASHVAVEDLHAVTQPRMLHHLKERK